MMDMVCIKKIIQVNYALNLTTSFSIIFEIQKRMKRKYETTCIEMDIPLLNIEDILFH